MPEIPGLKPREEKEKRGGAVPLPTILAARAPVATVAASAQLSWQSLILNNLTGKCGVAGQIQSIGLLSALIALPAFLLALLLNDSTDAGALTGWSLVLEQPASGSRVVRPVSGGLDLFYQENGAGAPARQSSPKEAEELAESGEALLAVPEQAAAQAAELATIGFADKKDFMKKTSDLADKGIGKLSDPMAAGGRSFSSPAGSADAAPIKQARAGEKTVVAKGERIGTTRGLRRERKPAGGAQRIATPNRSARTLQQLRFARTLSASAAQQRTGDSANRFARDAFDQASTDGVPTGVVASGMDALPPVGSGAPDLANVPNPVGENVTPFQDKVDDAKKNTNKAKAMMILGAALLALGAALIAAGMMKKKAAAAVDAQIATLISLAIVATLSGGGAAIQAQINALQAKKAALLALSQKLMAAGAAAILAGMLAMAMGKKAAQDAKNDGKQIEEQHGQPEQRDVIDECADQALAKQDCKPAPFQMPQTTIRRDVNLERQGALADNGGPLQPGVGRFS